MRAVFMGSLLLYLVPLLMSQTAYGAGFSSWRWLGLGAACAIGLTAWLAMRRPRGDTLVPAVALGFYLLCTGLSLPFAEDQLFSAFRWASHAAMLVLFYVFVREVVTSVEARWMTLGVKLGLAAAIILSIVAPAPRNYLDDEALFRGVFGNPNTLGHFSAVAFLLFVHGAASVRSLLQRNVELGLALVALGLVWHSGARSSFVALSAGLLILSRYYRGFFRRRLLLAFAALIVAAVFNPKLPSEMLGFVAKRGTELELKAENVLRSRLTVWQESWDGFTDRPLLGWGFGAHKGVSGDWQFGLQAVGYATRDLVNDTMFLLESAGVVGLLGFAVLAVVVLRHYPPGVRGMPPNGPFREVYDLNVLFAVLATSLLVLFQFDDTGFSAGNLPSALLWLFAGLAGAMRSEFVLICRQAAGRPADGQSSRVAREGGFLRPGGPGGPLGT